MTGIFSAPPPSRLRRAAGRSLAAVPGLPGAAASAVADIRDIKGPIELPSSHLVPLLAISGGIVLAGLLLLYLRRRRHRRRPQAAPSPRNRALARLARAETLTADTDPDRFATELTDILRSYIEARFHIPVRNRTSREFIGDLARDAAAPPLLRAHRDRLREWLLLCDMARFARAPLTGQQMRAMLEAVRDFIDATRPDQEEAAGTDNPDGQGKRPDHEIREVRQ